MADRIGPLQKIVEPVVAQITHDDVFGRHSRRAVRLRQIVIDGYHLVAAVAGLGGYLGADESGGPGHDDSHGSSIGSCMTSTACAQRHIRCDPNAATVASSRHG